MSFFSIPLSGLTAAQDQLQAVSNNLANLNTDGFKDQTVSFSDVYLQNGVSNGSGDPLQTGAGVKVAATNSSFKEGNLNPTLVPSNMAISGNGFFVTQSSGGVQDYTRAGDFTTNKAGQLINPSGELVLGYPAVSGVVTTAGALQPLQVGPATSPASVSTNFEFTTNLSSTAATTDPPANSNVAVFDSLGTQHNLTVQYNKTAAGSWSYSVGLPAADTGGLPAASTANGITTVATGTLSFDSNGKLSGATSVTPAAATIASPYVIPVSIPNLADGATAPLALKWNLSDVAGNSTLTQTAAPSGTSAANADGYASGTLSSFAVQGDGTILGTFTTGKTLALGQVAVAAFANTSGLVQTGDSSYQATGASGTAVIGVPGTGGRGTIVGGSVEQSNVDIATEFARLIVAQQAYQANAKSVTTFNQVSQATIAMIA